MKFSKSWGWGLGIGCTLTLVVCSGIVFSAFLRLRASLHGNSLYVHEDDPEINAAIGRARATSNRFVELLEKPPKDAEHFAIKVRLKHGTEAEFVWVNRLSYSNGKFYGVIAEAPSLVTSVKKGDQISAPRSEIADWIIAYRKGDGSVRYEGDEINKVLLARQRGHSLRYPSRRADTHGPRIA